MQLVGGKLQLKSVIFVQNVLNVYKLAKLAADCKDAREQNVYLSQLILELATVRGFFAFWFNRQWVREKHRNLINDLCEAAGMLKKEVPEKGAFEKFEEFVDYIAAAVNKTPHELKTSITTTQLQRWSLKVVERDLNRAYDLIRAYHIPREHLKDIKKQLDSLKQQAKQFTSDTVDLIAEKTEKAGKLLKMKGFRNPNEQRV